MAKLYYGNGEVTIEGSDIRGVEIRYNGRINVEKTAGDNFVLMHNNNAVIIFPLGDGYLNELFNYSGNMKIKSVIVAGEGGIRVPCTIKKVMDYSELLNSTSETMTTNSEDLSSGYGTSRAINETPQILENMDTNDKNLHTGGDGVIFYLQDGSPYEGAYHIMLKDSSCMTGSVHDEKSQDLYFKQYYDGKIIHKLIPTRNPSHVPPGVTLNNKRHKRAKGIKRRRRRK